MYRKNHVFSGNDDEDVKIFEVLFELHYSSLCSLAESFISDYLKAETLVTDVFLKIWNARMNQNISDSLKISLFKYVLEDALIIAGDATKQSHAIHSAGIKQLV